MRRAARQDLAVGPNRAAHSSGAYRDRHRDLLAEHRRLELPVRNVEHHPLPKADCVEVIAVCPERDLGKRTGLNIIHEWLRHAPVSTAPQVLDAGDAGRDIPHSSPREALSLIRSPMRSALAWMVSDGFTPPLVGNSDPSQIHKFGVDQLRPFLSATLSLGSLPIR